MKVCRNSDKVEATTFFSVEVLRNIRNVWFDFNHWDKHFQSFKTRKVLYFIVDFFFKLDYTLQWYN